MGLGDFVRRLLPTGGPGKGLPVEELARRLGTPLEELRSIRPSYREFTIPKRSGGARRIAAPEGPLAEIQRRILRRLLGRLRCHPAATGFERGKSIVANALPHVGRAVVVRMDLKDFFESTAADRVRGYFGAIGWNREASDLLARLCTHRGGLPQGAPSSPRLSNLVNGRLDARLSRLGGKLRAAYTRYADDMTFSFASDDRLAVQRVIHLVKSVVADAGYALHQKKKLQIRRPHQRQQVTGLVVNQGVRLPRSTRRWLRAVEHRAASGRGCTLPPAQLAGWRALRSMIERQLEKAGLPRGA